MAGTSAQGKENPVFWLATRRGKMGLSCLLGISRVSPARKKFPWPYSKSILYWPKRSWPAILDLAWSITHMSYLARAPQVSPLDTMPLCVWEDIALNLALDESWRNLSDGRENKYTCIRITGEIRQAASMFKKTAKSCRCETSQREPKD